MNKGNYDISLFVYLFLDDILLFLMNVLKIYCFQLYGLVLS